MGERRRDGPTRARPEGLRRFDGLEASVDEARGMTNGGGSFRLEAGA